MNCTTTIMLWDWFRMCGRCSTCLPPIDLWCEACWKEVWKARQFQERHLPSGNSGRNIPVFSLWDWTTKNSDVEILIKQRKSPLFDRAHERMAKYFYCEAGGAVGAPQCIVFPSKNLKVRDHTASLAKAFADFMDIPFFPVLLEPDENYKLKTQRERWQNRQAKAELVSELGVGFDAKSSFLFVDDVFTTGATAAAVWRALGRPKDFRVAVLAYKTLKYQQVNDFGRSGVKRA